MAEDEENRTEICGTIVYVFVSNNDYEPSAIDVRIDRTKPVEGYVSKYAGQRGTEAHVYVDSDLIKNAKLGWRVCCLTSITEDGRLIALPEKFILEGS